MKHELRMTDQEMSLTPGDAIDDDTVETAIGPDHRIIIRDQWGDVLIRIERPEGTGKALYETLALTYTEAEALLQALMDAVG